MRRPDSPDTPAAPTPDPPLSPEEAERKQKIATAKAKLLLLNVLLWVIALSIFIDFAAKGMRNMVSESAEMMSKARGVGRFFKGESTAGIDKAFVACTFVYGIVFTALKELLRIVHLGGEATDKHRRFVLVVASAGLLFDLGLMYCGIASLSWGNLRFSFPAVLFTGVYAVGTLWMALACAKLRHKINELEESLNPHR